MSWDLLFHLPFIMMVAFFIHAFSGKMLDKGVSVKVYYPLLILVSVGLYLLIFWGIGLVQFRHPTFN